MPMQDDLGAQEASQKILEQVYQMDMDRVPEPPALPAGSEWEGHQPWPHVVTDHREHAYNTLKLNGFTPRKFTIITESRHFDGVSGVGRELWVIGSVDPDLIALAETRRYQLILDCSEGEW